MKVEYIMPFCDSAHSFLKEVCGVEVKRGNIYLKPPTSIKDVAAQVNLTGDLEGRLLIEMSKETALYVASATLGKDVSAFDDSAKASIQKLANTIADMAKEKLKGMGYKLDSSPGGILSEGAKDSAANWEDIEALVLPLEFE